MIEEFAVPKWAKLLTRMTGRHLRKSVRLRPGRAAGRRAAEPVDASAAPGPLDAELVAIGGPDLDEATLADTLRQVHITTAEAIGDDEVSREASASAGPAGETGPGVPNRVPT